MPEAARASRWMRALLVVSIALPLALFVAISWHLHGERLRHGTAHVRQTVMVLEEHALRVFEAQQLIIDRVDQFIESAGWEDIRASETLHRFLRDVAASSPHVDAIWLVAPDGRTANSSAFFPHPEVDVSDREYMRALARSDHVHFGEMVVGRLTGELEFNLGRRRTPPADPGTAGGDGDAGGDAGGDSGGGGGGADRGGADVFDGIILVTSSLDYFTEFWGRASPSPRHVAGLFRPDGSVLARYPQLETVPERLPPGSQLRKAMAETESGVYMARSSIDGSERIYGYSRVGDYPVFVGFGIDRAEILAPWREDLVRHGLVSLSAAALLAGISLLALRQSRRLSTALASWRETAGRLASEADRRERAEDIAAEKERLLGALGAATAQRQAILDSMLEGVVAYGPAGRVIYCNAAARRILRLPGAAVPALDELAREGRIAAADGAALGPRQGPVARLLQGETLQQEELRLTLDGPGDAVVCRFAGAPLLDGAGRVTGAVLTFADVTEEVANEERRALLMNELDHRVRNMLATIMAMVRLSSHGADSKDALVRTLGGRIGAMSRTHNLLTRNSWRGAVLSDVVRDEVQPYAGEDRVVLEGADEVVLPPQDAVDFALVIHELATNAAKHGAWSGPEGRVEVSWSLGAAPVPHVRIRWQERGGPRVEPPARTGFGSTLIRAAFRREGAGVELRHEPDGVVCEIRVPLRADPALRPLAPAPSVPAAPLRPRPLQGLAVLLVEDEPIVRLELAAVLEDAGATVIGPAQNMREAMRLADGTQPDAALLDINLDGENVSPLAEALLARNVPLVFASGYRDLDLLSPRLRHLPLVQKPLRHDELIGALAACAGAHARTA